MDLTTLPASDDQKAALKQALLQAGATMSDDDRFYLYAGAMYGAEEVTSGVMAPPTGLDLLGPRFVEGRDLVVNFPYR